MTDAITRADVAVYDGLELVGLVREFGPDTINRWLRGRNRAGLEAVTIALAALVPIDARPSELLAWCDPDGAREERQKEIRLQRLRAAAALPPKECGTHAAFNRHKTNGEMPCEECRLGERLYQRARSRRRRQQVAA